MTSSSCSQTLSSSVGVSRGEWSHVAVVVDASHYTNEVIFYVNGVEAGVRRSSTRGEIVAPLAGLDHSPFVVGKGPCQHGCLDYKGHIDELFVYHSLWSASELLAWRDKPAFGGNATHRASPHFGSGVLGYSFDDVFGDDVKNVFPDPDDVSFGGNRFDGVISSRDASSVVWDTSDRPLLTNAIAYASPPSPAAAGATPTTSIMGLAGPVTCAVRSDGAVVCWGSNFYGLIGDGTNMDRLSPTAVVGITARTVTTLDAGDYHTIALLRDGSVVCWGGNNYGQLGDNTTTNRNAPVTVSGLTAGVVSSVAASADGTCAALKAGGVRCWGKNDVGQVGDGTTGTNRLAPVDVIGITGTVVKLFGGGGGGSPGTFCAVLESGVVMCWGRNEYGQCGDGTTTHRNVSVTNAAVAGTTFKALALGNDHGCVLLEDGSVKCWGSGYYGQLGDGSNTAVSYTGVAVYGITTAVSLDAGQHFSCASLTDGSVKCWGYNSYGMLGDGTTTNSSVPVIVSGISSATNVACGALHACAALQDGGMVCWGYNNYGQLGDNATVTPTTPVVVGEPALAPLALLQVVTRNYAPSSLRFNGVNASGFLKESSDGGKYLDFTSGGVVTFEAWIKPARFGKFQFLASTEGFGGDRAGWSIAIMCPTGAGEGCCGDHVDGSLGFMARKAVSSDCANARSSPTALALGTWQHVAVVVDATQTVANTGYGLVRRKVSFYVNGALVGVSTSSNDNALAPIQVNTPTHGPDSSGVRVGAGLCGQSDDMSIANGETKQCGHFDGWMDEMKLWHAALSDVTVKTHYAQETVAPWHVNREALVVFYKFNNNAGASVAPFDTRVDTTNCSGGSVVNVTDCSLFQMHDLSIHPASDVMDVWDANVGGHVIGNAPAPTPPSPPSTPPPTPPPQGGPSSLYFNGRDTHVSSLYVDSLLPARTGLTFQAWIKPMELHRAQVLAMLGSNGWSLMLICDEGSGGAGCCGPKHTHAPGTLMFWNVERVPGEAGDACADAPTSTRRVVKDTWQHVAVVADTLTDTVRFFINGEPAGVTTNARSVSGDRLVNDGKGSIAVVDTLSGSDAPTWFGGYFQNKQGSRTIALRGDVAVVGSPENTDAGIGAVYVFERDSSGWHETQILLPDVQIQQDMFFGWSVDVNAAGDVIVVGGKMDFTCGAGGCPAWVFTRDVTATPPAQWQLAQKLTPHYTTAYDHFGAAVGIDKNDDTIVIGAFQAGVMKGGTTYANAGAAFVFARDAPQSWSSNWTQLGCPTDCDKGLLVAVEDVSLSEFRFGQSLDIDNGVIAVNALVNHAVSAGTGVTTTVYVFTRNDTTDVSSAWSLAAKISKPPDVGNTAWNPYFANDVLVDGDTIVTTSTQTGVRAAFVFARLVSGDPQAAWVQTAKLQHGYANDANLPGDATGFDNSFGTSAAVSGDTIVVGARIAQTTGFGKGAVFVYTKDDLSDPLSSWSMQHQFSATGADALVNLDADETLGLIDPISYFGYNVAIDGEQIMVGAPGNVGIANTAQYPNRNTEGTVHVFSMTTSGLTLGRSGMCQCMQYKGFIDEVSLWNSSLTGADIKTHHTLPPVSWHRNYDSLVAYWAFDEGGMETSNTLPSGHGLDVEITVVSSSDRADVLWDAGVNLAVVAAPAPPPPPPPVDAPPFPAPPPPQQGPSALRFNGVDTEIVVSLNINGAPVLSSVAPSPGTPSPALPPAANDTAQYVADVTSHAVMTMDGVLLPTDDGVLTNEGGEYGKRVAIQGDTAVAVAVGVGAYVFTRNNATGAWSSVAKLARGDIFARPYFGASLAISQDERVVVVGSPGTLGTGSVFVYSRDASDSSVWSQTSVLDSGIVDVGFGRSAAMSGDTVVIAGTRSAYVFTQDSQNSSSMWTTVARLHDATASMFADCAPCPAAQNVAISGDTVVVGDKDSAPKGNVWVFTRDNPANRTSGWTARHKLRPSSALAGDGFGSQVAIHGDTVVAACANAGKVFVFSRVVNHRDAPWLERAALVNAAAGFGTSVATNGDAVFVATDQLLAPGDLDGSVLVYQRTHPMDAASGWVFTSRFHSGFDEMFGYHLAVNLARAGEVMVGAPIADVNGTQTGAAYVFQADAAHTAIPEIWTGENVAVVDKIFASDADRESEDWFGTSVAVSGDFMVVGTPKPRVEWDGASATSSTRNPDFGAAKVYVRDVPGDVSSSWTLGATLGGARNESWSSDTFGSVVAMDGDVLVVGDPANGQAYVFERHADTGEWQKTLNVSVAKISSPGHLARVGMSVAIGGDILVVGAPYTDVGASLAVGAAHVYARNASTWTLVEVVAPDAYVTCLTDCAGSQYFAASVATRNGVVVIGARAQKSAQVLICAALPTGCALDTILTGSNPGEAFAKQVSVGADADGVVVVVQGSTLNRHAEIFYRNAAANSTWSDPWLITSDDPDLYPEFGLRSIAVDGDVVVVGSPQRQGAVTAGAGAVFVFRRYAAPLGSNTVAWALSAKLTPTKDQHGHAIAGDLFGASVAVDGDCVVVGAPGDDLGKTTNAGSVYVFGASPPAPAPAPVLTPPPPPSTAVAVVAPSLPAPPWKFDSHANLTSRFAPRNALTFEAWIRPVSVKKTQFIASLGNYGWGVALLCGAGSGANCCGDHLDGAIGFWTHAERDAANCENTFASNLTVVPDVWQHIAVSVEVNPVEIDSLGFPRVGASVIRFYVNGVPAGEVIKRAPDLCEQTRSCPVQILNGTDVSALYLGRFGACNCLHYDGLIDEVKLWNAAVSGRVINQHKEYGVLDWHPNYENAIAWYKFDTAREFSIVDKLGNNNGTVLTTSSQADLWSVGENRVASVVDAPPAPPAPPSPPPTQAGPSALRFNGIDAFVLVDFNQTFVPPGALTLEAWVRPDRVSVAQHIAGIGNDGWSVRLQCHADGATEPDANGCCDTHAAGAIGFHNGDADAVCTRHVSTTGVATNQWSHVAVVFNSSVDQVWFYIDGVLIGTDSHVSLYSPLNDGAGSPDTVCHPLSFGAQIESSPKPCDVSQMPRSTYFQGWIDEITMWSAPLAQTTIAEYKDKSYAHWHPNAGSLIAYWKFDQATGYVAYEYFHTPGHNGKIVSSDSLPTLWDINMHADVTFLGSPTIAPPPPSPSPAPPPPLAPPPPPPIPPGRFEKSVAGDTSVYFTGTSDSYGVVAYDARLTKAVTDQALTVEAWIRPEQGEDFSRAQTIASLGDLGWGLQIMCPAGAGKYFPFTTFRRLNACTD